MKTENGKLDHNKLVNIPTGLNSFKTKEGNFYVDKLNTVPVDLKKLSDLVSKEVLKKTVYNKLNTKVNFAFRKNKEFERSNLEK